jgi:putative CocE/NonD family hydrolase
MKIVETFPHAVRDIENVFIPLERGGRLSARIWLPEDAESSPVPAILEYIPYRKGDRMRDRDESMHRHFAGHGYAAARIDVAGTGDSDGVLLDEYLPQEIDDACEAIRWLASRPWCTGSVGMMGKSWGGFNSLQVAAQGRAESLGAILTVCCSDDRYLDDAHFMGGSPLTENFFWGTVLTALRIMPPDPSISGERWREMWHERLSAASPLAEKWLLHQRRGDYWKQGSVSHDYRAITCPVFAVGGWADAYSNAIFRLLAGLDCPRKGLIGPWAHAYPQEGVPGPAIGFLQEALRWWDHWLKGRDTGIMDEPMLRVWMPDSSPPASARYLSPGRWVSEPAWPPSHSKPRTFGLASGKLIDQVSAARERIEIRSPCSTGSQAGAWCPFGAEGMPRDQRPDDERSVVFDTPPLSDRVEILGAPVLRVKLSSDLPVATLVARLEDVFPDGVSARVSYGVLNLTHRSDHARPEPLPLDAAFEAVMPLNHVAHSFAPGNRIRLALSTSYWPILWPAPEEASLELQTETSSIELPVRAPRREDELLRSFEPPEQAPFPESTTVSEGKSTHDVHHDRATGESVRAFSADFTQNGEPALTRIEATGLSYGDAIEVKLFIRDGDPLSARAEMRHHALFQRRGWSIGTRVAARMTADQKAFHLETDIEGFEGDERVFSKRFRSEVPRDLA